MKRVVVVDKVVMEVFENLFRDGLHGSWRHHVIASPVKERNGGRLTRMSRETREDRDIMDSARDFFSDQKGKMNKHMNESPRKRRQEGRGQGKQKKVTVKCLSEKKCLSVRLRGQDKRTTIAESCFLASLTWALSTFPKRGRWTWPWQGRPSRRTRSRCSVPGRR